MHKYYRVILYSFPKVYRQIFPRCSASDRLFGVTISGGDFRKCMQTRFSPHGVDMLVARGQIRLVHQVFAPTQKGSRRRPLSPPTKSSPPPVWACLPSTAK